MEHIVQFAIGIDDDAIKDRIMQNAEKKITDDIEQQVRDALFDRGWKKHANIDDPLNGYSERIVSNFLEQHKQEIIDKAAEHLADKLSRTKAAKEMLTEVLYDNG